MEDQFKALIVLSHYLEVRKHQYKFILGSRKGVHWLFKTLVLLLQTGRFQQFWDEAAKNRHIFEAVPGTKVLNHKQIA